jgi:hypothetical protein
MEGAKTAVIELKILGATVHNLVARANLCILDILVDLTFGSGLGSAFSGLTFRSLPVT